jgi:hypothetical protein
LPKLERAALPHLDLAESNLAQILLPFRQNTIDELHSSALGLANATAESSKNTVQTRGKVIWRVLAALL